MRYILNAITFSFTVILLGALALNAHAGKRHGYYMGIELGLAEQEDFDIGGSDNDVPTRCDAQLNAVRTGDEGEFVTLDVNSLNSDDPVNGCQRGQDSWETDGDLDIGVLGGLQIGYMFGNNWRAELEYVYRDNNGGDSEDAIDIGDPKEAELARAEQAISNISSHSLFANLYYDFVSKSKFTPYIGAGVGWSKTRMEYDAVFARNFRDSQLPDRDVNNGEGGTPDVAAGTTTHTRDTLTDTSFGWQVMAGADYDLGDNWSLGLKVRYMHLNDAKDTKTWDALRSHSSAISSDDPELSNPTTTQIRDSDPSLANFDPTVRYTIDTDDLKVWGVGINLKYAF